MLDRTILTVAIATIVVGAPFISLWVPDPRLPTFQAWAIVWTLLATPVAGLLFGWSLDRRAEFSERALQNGNLDSDCYIYAIDAHHVAKRQLLILSAVTGLVPAGLFMALIFPATDLIELSAVFGVNNLTINTKNAGFALMTVAAFGLCIIGIASVFFKPRPRKRG